MLTLFYKGARLVSSEVAKEILQKTFHIVNPLLHYIIYN